MHRRRLPLHIPSISSFRCLARFLHSEPLPSDPRLGFVRQELQSIDHRSSPLPNGPQQHSVHHPRSDVAIEVEVSHPWPEWVHFMGLLFRKGYLDRSNVQALHGSSYSFSASKDSNSIRTACLNFARDRLDIVRYLSRRDIYIIGQCGCPSLDRKVVNSGKRMRAHVGIQEGDVCSSCSLRGNCDRAYVKAREEEVGRTVDVMRILLTYGLDVITGSVENPACLNKTVHESVKKLLNEMVEFGSKDVNSNSLMSASKRHFARQEKSSTPLLFKGQISVPMKQGDWICPICNFLNFAKNMKCLHCNGESQERFKRLQEDENHLPLKKGDWICEKCNFLNFAKNTKCLQCHEKPCNRQLNPGEWECVSCNYINFRKNAFCLKCGWKRPKAMNDFSTSQPDGQTDGKSCGFTFVRDSVITGNKSVTQDSELGFPSFVEAEIDDSNGSKFDLRESFDNFPIIGGSSEVSQNPTARQRWKEKMFKTRHQEPITESIYETDGLVASARHT
ncbi:uncharacterized protein LOC122051089 [Zingiber officinale]|uniref:uncharacterized protein LOC122051089 n=1 Tax=Zingiber officinale TaxID=94328 RepID=UPI001C4B716A|nr:uncharacterized protein LOC122051089 [Zingiber officinale]XP_042467974.1 uncharacterized protein LOC122051089 [Zingiber officinale]